MARKQYIFLVPGFLGFAHVGRLTYFGHVRRFLGERLAAAGLEPHIHIVRTSPTSSLPVRAARVAEVIHATTPRGRAAVHLIGHSSGGLDVRLFTAPGIELPTALDVARLTARVQTVITVSTPHHGTPLASFFTTSRGQQLMQLLALSTIYVLNFGHLPLAGLLWMGSFLLRFGGLVADNDLLDELFGKLLEDFTPARRRAVRRLLRDVVHDQALMLQLTPEAMEVFNASVVRRPGIRYGTVVSRAPPPSLHATLHAGFDPASQVTHALYGALHRLIEATPQRVFPKLAPQQARALKRAYGVLPSPVANDGIVPTISQTWGRVVHAAVADHLDVLGHYRDAATAPPHIDWLVSGSAFDRRRFEALWTDVARFLAPDARSQPKRQGAADRPPRKARGRKQTRRS